MGKPLRWLLSLLLIVVGISIAWAWGQVVRLAEPQAAETESQPLALYAAWQPAGSEQTVLFRSTDGGSTWQPLSLPAGKSPRAWADDGGRRLAVALDGGLLLRSEDQGESWSTEVEGVRVLGLVWGEAGDLYLGTDGQGIYRLAADGSLAALATAPRELASAAVRHLAWVDGRLFAATPTALFYTDDGGRAWAKSLPVPDWVTALAATDRKTIYVGTATTGIYKSTDAGQIWRPALDGLGLAAGQMVQVTALRADPGEPSVLYAAVDHLLGSTQVHASAAGTFVTLDGGASWQPLTGPAFPEAGHASSLVVVPGRPLYVQAVTAHGLQGYSPDIAGALAALQSGEPQAQVAAARVLGLAQAKEAGKALLLALGSSDPAVSLAAADALGRIKDPATVSSLLPALDHPQEQVRLAAARALGLMGVEGAVGPLRTMFLRGEGATVSVAGQALARIGSPAAIDALLTALADPTPTARWHVALAGLESLGEPAVPQLVEMLNSKDAVARRNAAQALGWVGSPAATRALVEALRDRDTGVRERAAWALGEIGDPAARAALERAQARDASAQVRTEAGLALIRLREQPASAPAWPVSLAVTLNRLQAMRWLILGLSLAGATWLAVGNRQLASALALQRSLKR